MCLMTRMLNPGVDSRVKRELSCGMDRMLTIGRLAAASGVSVDTIRYYERIRLLPKAQRTPAGYRIYPPPVVKRLHVIRGAQRFGFSLDELAAFLRVRDAGGTPCRDVRAAAQRILDAVDREIHDLAAARADAHDAARLGRGARRDAGRQARPSSRTPGAAARREAARGAPSHHRSAVNRPARSAMRNAPRIRRRSRSRRPR